jgi:hypothetical protein
MSNDTQNLTGDAMIGQFIDKLVVDAEMDKNLEESTLLGLKKDLQARLENRIKAMILSEISADKLDEFEKIIDSGDATITQKFCMENITDFPELLAGEFLNFRNRYVA